MSGKRFCLGDYYPEASINIYRYMKLWKFMHLLFKRSLYLSRGDRFEDLCEGKETELSRGIRETFHDRATFEENSQLYERNRRCIALSCWYMADNESPEMWIKYAPGPDGIVVCSTVGKLKEALTKYETKTCIRKVEYVDNHNDQFTKFGCSFYPFSIKEGSFGNEKELRVIYGEGKACNNDAPLYKVSEELGTGLELEIDIITLVESVIFSPEAPSWFCEAIRETIESLNVKLDIRASAFTNNVT